MIPLGAFVKFCTRHIRKTAAVRASSSTTPAGAAVPRSAKNTAAVSVPHKNAFCCRYPPARHNSQAAMMLSIADTAFRNQMWLDNSNTAAMAQVRPAPVMILSFSMLPSLSEK